LPVDCQIDHDVKFVTITGRGDVTLVDLVDCMDVIVAQDAMGYPKLIDTRGSDHSLSDDDIMTMGARAQAYALIREGRSPSSPPASSQLHTCAGS
jgi:hypothetical protein